MDFAIAMAHCVGRKEWLIKEDCPILPSLPLVTFSKVTFKRFNNFLIHSLHPYDDSNTRWILTNFVFLFQISHPCVRGWFPFGPILIVAYSVGNSMYEHFGVKKTHKVQCRIHKGSPRIPILSRINPTPHIDTYFFKVYSNIVPLKSKLAYKNKIYRKLIDY
jgi:hypothetical protein